MITLQLMGAQCVKIENIEMGLQTFIIISSNVEYLMLREIKYAPQNKRARLRVTSVESVHLYV